MSKLRDAARAVVEWVCGRCANDDDSDVCTIINCPASNLRAALDADKWIPHTVADDVAWFTIALQNGEDTTYVFGKPTRLRIEVEDD